MIKNWSHTNFLSKNDPEDHFLDHGIHPMIQFLDFGWSPDHPKSKKYPFLDFGPNPKSKKGSKTHFLDFWTHPKIQKWDFWSWPKNPKIPFLDFLVMSKNAKKSFFDHFYPFFENPGPVQNPPPPKRQILDRSRTFWGVKRHLNGFFTMVWGWFLGHSVPKQALLDPKTP